MKLIVEIELEHESIMSYDGEVRRALLQVHEGWKCGETDGYLKDSNNDKVGEWRIT